MLKHRFIISLLGTILLYASVGLLFFYLLNQTIGTEQKPQEKIITFTLSEYKPEVIPPVEVPIEEPIKEEKVKPIVEEKPIIEEPKPVPVVEEVSSEPIIEKLITKPVVKKVVKKKTIKKKQIKKKVVKNKSLKKRVPKRKTITKKAYRKKKVSKKQASPAKKNKFLNQLRAKISRNKMYPRIAQRRGMQGSVKVRFTILRNGHVSNIEITGKKVFHKSARKAIKQAFPINVKKAPLSLPTTVNLTLRYQIR